MLQPGDVGLIASLKIAFFGVVFGIIMPAVWIIIFFFGFGFIGMMGSPGSTSLPPLEYLSPAFLVCLVTLMMVSTYDRSLMLPGVVLALIATGFTLVWEVLPVFRILGFCSIGSLACSMGDFWIYFFYLLLVGWLEIGLFITLFSSITYMSGYWQREYYMSRESSYQQVVDGQTYDPTFDPDDPDENIREGDFDHITKETRLAKSDVTEAQEEADADEKADKEIEEGDVDKTPADEEDDDAAKTEAAPPNVAAGLGLTARNVAFDRKKKKKQ